MRGWVVLAALVLAGAGAFVAGRVMRAPASPAASTPLARATPASVASAVKVPEKVAPIPELVRSTPTPTRTPTSTPATVSTAAPTRVATVAPTANPSNTQTTTPRATPTVAPKRFEESD